MTRTTVLVVEDEEPLAEVFAEWLSPTYEVRTAATVSAAREALDDHVDVALVDRRLPDGSGADVLESVRDRGLEPRTAMVTAVDPDFDILEMGFDAYVVKPVTADELRSVVRGLVARDRYSNDVRRYYALASKRAVLEARKADDELDANEEYAALVEELSALEAALDDRLDEFAEDDFAALFREF